MGNYSELYIIILLIPEGSSFFCVADDFFKQDGVRF